MENIWRELVKAAEIIDGWTNKQRKIYLKRLKERERRENRTLYRNIIKMMLIDTKRRKRFIKVIKKDFSRNI